MGKKIALTLVIPAKDPNCPKLKNLLSSIDRQEFPKDILETLVITDGTSESAKAIGVKRANGKVIGFLASDNLLIDNNFLSMMYMTAMRHGASTTSLYHYSRSYGLMDRYFALIGGNDPLSYWLGKNDRGSYIKEPTDIYYRGSFPTFGDNGFFIKRSIILKSDIENYYHIDNIWDVFNTFELKDISYMPIEIAHLSGEKFVNYFKKRYRYGLQHAFCKNRRWHLVERRDVWKVIVFTISTLIVIPNLVTSVRGYLKIRDLAWFMHPLISLGILFTYGILTVNLLWTLLLRSLSVRSIGETA